MLKKAENTFKIVFLTQIQKDNVVMVRKRTTKMALHWLKSSAL